MKPRFPLYLALSFALALGLFLAAPDAAQASCNGFCETVAPGCQECVTLPDETGARCDQQAPCFCIYKECGSLLLSSADPSASPAGLPSLLEAEPAASEEPEAPAGGCDPTAVLFGDWIETAAG